MVTKAKITELMTKNFTQLRTLGLLVALMALSVPMVYADNSSGDKDSWHQDGGWHHGKKDHMMGKILNLTADQEKQLKDIRQKQMETMKSTFEQMKPVKEALETEIVKAAPDMSKVNDLENQLKTIKGQMQDNHLNSILAIKKVLTPEQFAGYMALEKAKKMMMHKGHGKFGHKDGACKMGDGQKHWGDKADQDNDEDGD